ncbi:M23 family metallopeptidase [Varibaculum vaginae]|uniref:M23 family metallopeptidase n=1 Tax=Varibaculum vaginae TaxID=2364797 RepID=UPI0011C4A22F|nr:M23 family metallopeptidase [Varibaculum vaginae]
MKKNLYSFGALLAALGAALLLAFSPPPPALITIGGQGFGQNVNLARLAGEIGHYQWPSRHRVKILRAFNPPTSPWGSGHRGVDLDMSAGSEVFSARAGTVFFVGTIAGKPSISIKHTKLIRTTYTPVTSDLAVGTAVKSGQKIGILQPGHPGLHFGAKIDDYHYLNPLLLILGPIRLLPDA